MNFIEKRVSFVREHAGIESREQEDKIRFSAYKDFVSRKKQVRRLHDDALPLLKKAPKPIFGALARGNVLQTITLIRQTMSDTLRYSFCICFVSERF